MDLALNRITNLAFGYWQGQCLFALTEHRVFDVLAEGPATAAAICAARGLDAGVAERVLDAGVALGLLAKQGGAYANTPLADRLLVSDAEDGLAHWVRVMGQWVRPWSQLPETLQTGRTAASPDTGDADARDFVLGMHEFARRAAGRLPELSGLTDPRHLVDVGGGAGTYATAFAVAFADLRVTVLDRPEVLPVTQEVAKQAGVADRVSTSVVDYRTDPLGEQADAVLFSNVLHQESEEVVVDMLRRGVAALADPAIGRILVHGHFLDESRTAPLFGTLHNLSAVLLWGSGRSYTGEDLRGLMRRAGLEPSELIPVPGSTTRLIVGTPVVGTPVVGSPVTGVAE